MNDKRDFDILKSTALSMAPEKLNERHKEMFADRLARTAIDNDLPITGITILGGRFYVNVSGLDSKLQRDGRKVKRIDYELIQRATSENGYLAGYVGIVEFEDTEERMLLRNEIISKALEAGKSPDEISRIVSQAGLSPPIYRDEGWCSPKTASAIAYDYTYNESAGRKLPDKKNPLIENVMMMAIRKATNRAKRQAIGCGLTSVEEVMGQNERVSEPKKEEKSGVKRVKSKIAETNGKDEFDEFMMEEPLPEF
jgi:hypothetical protein